MAGDPLEGYATFTAVVECGGFSAAASRLGVSKSAVSKQVSRLEERLGARLLNRTTRRLALTEAGKAVHQHAMRILAEAEEAELAVSQLHASPRGLLRVSCPMSFGIRHLAPVLGPFLQRYPELTLEAAYDDRLVDLVAEGFDMAVRIARLADSSLIARKLAPCRRVAVASPDYVARKGMPMHPADLSDHDILLYTLQRSANTWSLIHTDGSRAEVTLSGRLPGQQWRRLAYGGSGRAGCHHLAHLHRREGSGRWASGARDAGVGGRSHPCLCRLSAWTTPFGEGARLCRFPGRCLWTRSLLGCLGSLTRGLAHRVPRKLVMPLSVVFLRVFLTQIPAIC